MAGLQTISVFAGFTIPSSPRHNRYISTNIEFFLLIDMEATYGLNLCTSATRIESNQSTYYSIVAMCFNHWISLAFLLLSRDVELKLLILLDTKILHQSRRYDSFSTMIMHESKA